MEKNDIFFDYIREWGIILQAMVWTCTKHLKLNFKFKMFCHNISIPYHTCTGHSEAGKFQQWWDVSRTSYLRDDIRCFFYHPPKPIPPYTHSYLISDRYNRYVSLHGIHQKTTPDQKIKICFTTHITTVHVQFLQPLPRGSCSVHIWIFTNTFVIILSIELMAIFT